MFHVQNLGPPMTENFLLQFARAGTRCAGLCGGLQLSGLRAWMDTVLKIWTAEIRCISIADNR